MRITSWRAPEAGSFWKAELQRLADRTLSAINIEGDEFHPEWNYTVTPSVI